MNKKIGFIGFLVIILMTGMNVFSQKCMFVGNSNPLSAEDQHLSDKLTEWGYDVTTALGSDLGLFTDADYADYDFIFVSETIGSTEAAPLKLAPRPILLAEPWAHKPGVFDWVSVRAGDDTPAEPLQIVDNTNHPMAIGFSEGDIVDFVSGGKLGWTTPDIDIIPIAVTESDPTKYILYGVEKGTVLIDGEVTQNRIACFGIHTEGYIYITDTGFEFLKAQIEWILEGTRFVPPSPPPGGWNYTFDCDAVATDDNAALDGTWMHDNNSDSWALDAIGDGGMPGGVSQLMDGASSYLRMQEPGDPRDYAMPDPSNRKISFIHFLENDGLTNTESIIDDGITLAFRARVATGAPLDDMYADKGTEATPWPAEGKGYVIHDGGNGNFMVRQSFGGYVGFAMALKTDHEELIAADKQGLIMNALNGTDITGDVGPGQGGTLNIVELDDPSAWHDFWIAIHAGGTAGTHVVQVWVDGAADPQSFEVTAGAGGQAAGTTSYIQMGVGNTAQAGAFDADYFYYKEGAYAPDGTSLTTDVTDADADLPQEFALYGNYPNPFNPTTEIRFVMKQYDKVNISVYNVRGQIIETLFDGDRPAGIHSVQFDATNHASGVFFYRMTISDKVYQKKMLLMK